MTTQNNHNYPMNIRNLLSPEQKEKLKNVWRDYNVSGIGSTEGGLQSVEENNERLKQLVKHDELNDEALFMVDLGVVVSQMAKWRHHLPEVTPFYAMKCNGNPALLDTMNALEAGFDCASPAEFLKVVSMGVNPDRIIYANPCKQVSHIKAAKSVGMKLVTFDNSYELDKLKEHWEEAALVLRVTTDDNASRCPFSTKFGAPLHEFRPLIKKVKDLGLNLVGVSFHVGSGCGDALAFVKALENASLAWREAESQGFHPYLLDIGGGFPGDELASPTFEDIAAVLRPKLAEFSQSGVTIIAEPGRFFAAASHSLATNVFAKRTIAYEATRGGEEEGVEDDGKEVQYYVNDGVYQSFNCLFFDHAEVFPYPLLYQKKGPIQRSTIFGPTCDALDCIAQRIPFPEMEPGDWIGFHNMGAYTIAAASSFNGFHNWRTEYVSSLDFT